MNYQFNAMTRHCNTSSLVKLQRKNCYLKRIFQIVNYNLMKFKEFTENVIT